MARLYAATGDSIARLEQADHSWHVELSLRASGAQCVAVDPDDPETVFAGLRAGGVRRTRDGGRSWIDCALPEPGVFSLAVSAADGAVYAGTEPSALYRSDDSGETWRELNGLLELPSRPTWSFPPRPWTSHVRWIAPSPHHADLILVGIELGGLMRSTDGGATWQDHRPGAARDVHSLAWHPRTDGRAYEAGGDGAAWSEDAGETWQAANQGRDPQARIFRRHDGGWRALAGGLPEPLQAMPYALVATERRLFAGLADGQLWESSDRGGVWRACALRGDALTELHALAL